MDDDHDEQPEKLTHAHGHHYDSTSGKSYYQENKSKQLADKEVKSSPSVPRLRRRVPRREDGLDLNISVPLTEDQAEELRRIEALIRHASFNIDEFELLNSVATISAASGRIDAGGGRGRSQGFSAMDSDMSSDYFGDNERSVNDHVEALERSIQDYLTHIQH